MGYYYPPYGGDPVTKASAAAAATTSSPYTYGYPPSSTQAGDSGEYGQYGPRPISTVLLAHIICGALATLLFLPLGGLLPRIVRTYTTSRWWFPVHAATQGIIGTILIIAAFACGRSLNEDPNGVHFKMGSTLFALVLAQALLGAIVHWFKRFPGKNDATGRSPLNYVHVLLGLSVIIIGWFQVWYGVWYELGRLAYPVPGWNWRAGWIVVVVLWFLLYIGTYLVSALHRHRTTPSAQLEKQEQSAAIRTSEGYTIETPSQHSGISDHFVSPRS